MSPWREKSVQLDLTSDSHVENAMRMTRARRRFFNDLIGIRISRDISQAQVARAIGINRSGVSRFESDAVSANLTMDVILRYAHAVGASVELRAEPVEVTERRLKEGEAWQVRRVKRVVATPPPAVKFVEALSVPGNDSQWTRVSV